MIFVQVVAQGHNGYPQPESDYYKSVYVTFCERCGIHGSQSAPFQVKRVQLAPHSDFLRLNWVFDGFFARPDVAVELANNGIDRITFGPVLDHRTGAELRDRRQMRINTVISCVDTSRLSNVTCQADNEESQWKIAAGRTRYDASTPYCGGVKHHPPASVTIKPNQLGNTPDLFQTAEWFGSGGAAHRLTLCTERFAESFKSHQWRGLEFRTVQDPGCSKARSGDARPPNGGRT